MSAQHTPGPWTYHQDSGSSCAALIATGSFVCEFIEAPNEANARLIAAAPELLDALRIFIGAAFPVSTEINERGHNWSEAYLEQALEIARRAIAKATRGAA